MIKAKDIREGFIDTTDIVTTSIGLCSNVDNQTIGV